MNVNANSKETQIEKVNTMNANVNSKETWFDSIFSNHLEESLEETENSFCNISPAIKHNSWVIKNAQISFSSLRKFESIQGKTIERYSATLLIPKTRKNSCILDDIVKNVMEEKFGISGLKNLKHFIVDGNTKDYIGWEDKYSLKTTNKKPPYVIDKNGEPIPDDIDSDHDSLLCFKMGNYVNALIDVYSMSNNFGNRVSARLIGIKFHKEGNGFDDVVDVDVIKNELNV